MKKRLLADVVKYLFLNIGLMDVKTELGEFGEPGKCSMWLGDNFDWLGVSYRRPFCESGGSGGQFAGLMDGAPPSSIHKQKFLTF